MERLLLFLAFVMYLVWFNSLARRSKKKLNPEHHQKPRPGIIKTLVMVLPLFVLGMIFRGSLSHCLMGVAAILFVWYLIDCGATGIYSRWRTRCQNIYIYSTSSRGMAKLKSKLYFYSPLLAIPLAIMVLVWIF